MRGIASGEPTTALAVTPELLGRLEQVTPLIEWEGGGASLALLDSRPALLVDEGTMADFLEPEDRGMVLHWLFRFDDLEARERYLRRRRWPVSVEEARDWSSDEAIFGTEELEEAVSKLSAGAAEDERLQPLLQKALGWVEERARRRDQAR
jgi:hypothetical protein